MKNWIKKMRLIKKLKKMNKLNEQIYGGNFVGPCKRHLQYKKGKPILGEPLSLKKYEIEKIENSIMSKELNYKGAKLSFKEFDSVEARLLDGLVKKGLIITNNNKDVRVFKEEYNYFFRTYNGDDYKYFSLPNIKRALEESEKVSEFKKDCV